ncbi:MAG: glycosyltransferase family 39 protein [Anaerolineaceae bacterium]|nr:glycosyltransferase family 39 protein [Anaerolineaceae bacterium]
MDFAILSAKNNTRRDSWLDKPVFAWWPGLTIEKLLIVIILVLTIFTRFYDLGARTMSHDEINHVVPAYSFSNYVYDPVTHGPFQFHALAFSYFMFGDSDFSARIPAATFGIAIVVFAIFAWRRYLGRTGGLIAGVMFMISPYILYYSRYTRNEVFIVFWGIVMLWLMLRYLEDGKHKWLYWLVLINAMHYADKATSFIFSAEALIFLALLFIGEVLRKEWGNVQAKSLFRIAVVVTLILLVVTMSFYVLGKNEIVDPAAEASHNIPLLLSAGLTAIAIVFALVTLFSGYGWKKLSHLRSFDLIWLQLILILPLLTAIPLRLLGFVATDYTQTGIIRSGIVFVLLMLLSLFLGLLWNRKVFLRSMAIFWGIFIVFYTSFFTHGEGFFKGIVGALGYWMSQQAVERGTQPLYYYAFVQIPMYEYLPAFGVLLAFFIGLRKRLFFASTEDPFTPLPIEEVSSETVEMDAAEEFLEEVVEEEILEETTELDLLDLEEEHEPELQPWYQRIFPVVEETGGQATELPTLLLLIFWSVMSLLAFTVAGERMPWLTTHITMPMILTSGWAFGYLVEKINWEEVRQRKGWLVVLLAGVFLVAFGSLLGSLLGNNPPFQGKDLFQLQGTSDFLLALVGTLGTGIGLFWLLKGWNGSTFGKLLLLVFAALLGIQTARTAWRAAFIDYDNARELLVYAHSTEDMKNTVEQIEAISKRQYGDKSIKIAYDNDVRYPYWWYMRDYPNKLDFGADVTKSLQDYPIIVVGTSNFARIEPVVRDDYYQYEYKRMWWPNEDLYRNWSLSRIIDDLTTPAKRSALWELWFNRDYTEYALAFNNPSLTLATWSPADNARMFMRKDVAAKIWEFGISPEPEVPRVDPYEGGMIDLEPALAIAVGGEVPFSAPRDIATAPDGSLFVADSRNHRIVHLDATGMFLDAWGGYGNVLDGEVPGGLFNEPWGVAVGPDGLVYVADTWNHRIQVFSSDGAFLRMWNSFDVLGVVDGFWGPRGIAVDADNRVFVTDTGKQRVVIFDSQGNYLTQFGSLGLEAGKLDEPVGIDIAADGRVYIADTWNYRVQVFAPDAGGLQYQSVNMWDVDAWSSDTLDNKPFLELDERGNVYVTDPDRGRVIVFDGEGQFMRIWGGFDNTYTMNVISGVTIGADGSVWVSDAFSNTLLKFVMPE